MSFVGIRDILISISQTEEIPIEALMDDDSELLVDDDGIQLTGD